MLHGSAIEILLVEDSPADRDLMISTLKNQKFETHISYVEDGQDALDFLFHREHYVSERQHYCDAPVPDLIFLDLNLPRVDGKEVLSEIKKDSRLKSIPVVIMSTSDSIKDITDSYALNASCYITKPISLGEFRKVIETVSQFWFSIVKLPPHQL